MSTLRIPDYSKLSKLYETLSKQTGLSEDEIRLNYAMKPGTQERDLALVDHPNALQYVYSLGDEEYAAKRELYRKGKKGLFSKTYIDEAALIDDLIDASKNFSLDSLEEPSYESITADILSGKDASVQNYLDILAEDEARRTQVLQDQLEENRLGFDQYRQQLLSNQYQQNAQLLGSVETAMDKSRRNALEAGASAGLRMAENINTTLALQNKQSQTSLETSNQLAQQLLNQRQANAGIRSEYNQMLSDNAAERRSYLENKVEETHARKLADYDRAVAQRNTDIANSTNPLARSYSNWYDNKNKSQSQYN